MTDIYDLHTKAFQRVSAYVIARDGERVATIAFKFPADGAGRLYAYVHWVGVPMVRGFAGGYGYDKRTAACASAIGKLMARPLTAEQAAEMTIDGLPAFESALATDRGPTWETALREAGFTVWQAV
jgi:hypothetical protein